MRARGWRRQGGIILLATRRRAEMRGGCMRLIATSAAVRRIIELTGTHEALAAERSTTARSVRPIPYGQEDEAVRWVAVRHGDDHIHLVAMLARQDGGKPSVSWERYKVRAACLAAEQRYGLRCTATADHTAARYPTRAESEKAARRGLAEAPDHAAAAGHHRRGSSGQRGRVLRPPGPGRGAGAQAVQRHQFRSGHRVLGRPARRHHHEGRTGLVRRREDAVLIARLASKLRCYEPERADAVWARLRYLGARRGQLTTGATAVNQIRDLLECAWPAVLAASPNPFRSVSWCASLAVVLDRCAGDPGRVPVAAWTGSPRWCGGSCPGGAGSGRASGSSGPCSPRWPTRLGSPRAGPAPWSARIWRWATGGIPAPGSPIPRPGCARSGRGRPGLRVAAWRDVWAAMPNNAVMAARFTHLTTRQDNRLARQQARTACAAALLRWIHVVVTRRVTWDLAVAAGGTPLRQAA